jgi:TonB family protein
MISMPTMRAFGVLLLIGLVPGFLCAAPTVPYVPMKVIQTDAVVFPRRALDVGVTQGDVHVVVQVDESGKLTDYLLTAYTHRILADSAVSALKRWRFEPAWVNGQARGATADLTFTFENRGIVVVDLTLTSYVQLRDIQLRPNAYEYHAVSLRQLDRIPTPAKVIQPVLPPEVLERQKEPVTVTVYFYIDQDGKVRLPAVDRQVSEKNDAFAAASVNAISQWQFEPPLSRGLPVLVAARQEVNFKVPLPATK